MFLMTHLKQTQWLDSSPSFGMLKYLKETHPYHLSTLEPISVDFLVGLDLGLVV